MKKLFTSIRQGKPDEVARILDRKPELTSGTMPSASVLCAWDIPWVLGRSGAGVFPAATPDAGHRDEPKPDSFPGNLGAWEHALGQYDQFAHGFFSDDPQSREREMEENRRLREMLRAVLDELLKHGADIRGFEPPNKDGLPTAAAVPRNLAEDRELLDGLHGLDPDSDTFKPCAMKCRGRERLVRPYLTVEDYRPGGMRTNGGNWNRRSALIIGGRLLFHERQTLRPAENRVMIRLWNIMN